MSNHSNYRRIAFMGSQHRDEPYDKQLIKESLVSLKAAYGDKLILLTAGLNSVWGRQLQEAMVKHNLLFIEFRLDTYNSVPALVTAAAHLVKQDAITALSQAAIFFPSTGRGSALEDMIANVKASKRFYRIFDRYRLAEERWPYGEELPKIGL